MTETPSGGTGEQGQPITASALLAAGYYRQDNRHAHPLADKIFVRNALDPAGTRYVLHIYEYSWPPEAHLMMGRYSYVAQALYRLPDEGSATVEYSIDRTTTLEAVEKYFDRVYATLPDVRPWSLIADEIEEGVERVPEPDKLYGVYYQMPFGDGREYWCGAVGPSRAEADKFFGELVSASRQNVFPTGGRVLHRPEGDPLDYQIAPPVNRVMLLELQRLDVLPGVDVSLSVRVGNCGVTILNQSLRPEGGSIIPQGVWYWAYRHAAEHFTPPTV